jgi:para-aminobenzoate synthetase component II
MILIIDNYDSFTYNIVQRLGELSCKVKVIRNDNVNIAKVNKLKPSQIIVSPGPCTPNETGNTNKIIKHFAGKIPILGICLGHQCIAYAFGGRIIRNNPVHGKENYIYHDKKTIYNGIKQGFIAGRYHSLIVDKKTLPKCFEISAWNKKGKIMGIRHKDFKLEGVQFHPESIITNDGYKILKNFIEDENIP